MANVTIAGATYSNVPAIQVPSGSGTALFYETKDVTYNLTGGASASVTPSEVVAGQGFTVKLKAPAGYNLSNVSVTMGGVDITSQVLTADSWSWMGSEVESLGTLYEHDFTLDDTSFSTWTASTTAGSILATANAGTISADMSQYEYFLHWTFRLDAAYTSGATLKAIPYRECQDAWQHCLRRPNSLATIADNDFLANGCVTVMTAPLLDYYNTSGTRAYTYSNSNGIYPTVQAATFSNSTSDTPTVTVKRPIIYAKCHNSYFATSRKANIDTTNTKFTLKCEAFRVPIGGIARVAYQNLINTYNAT